MQWVKVGCVIMSVTPGSPASDAGVAEGDEIAVLDGTRIDTQRQCDELTRLITVHNSGDVIELDLVRGDDHVTVKPILATRSDVLGRRVGQRAQSTDLADTDGKHWDLAEHRGHTLVVGAYTDNCGTACAAVIDRVADK